jgi:hypothetical protein
MFQVRQLGPGDEAALALIARDETGLASILFGAFTGVSAVLIGRKTLTEIGNGQQGFTGQGETKTGVVFGWLGIFF